MNDILSITGAVFIMIWGTAHMFPTKSIVKGFGDISEDNKRILTMEWINEGLTLIFLGLLIVVTTFFGQSGLHLTKLINIITSIMLFGMAILSLFTGYKIKFIPFKLCPYIFACSAILILLGAYL